jgi:hypothetical protein
MGAIMQKYKIYGFLFLFMVGLVSCASIYGSEADYNLSAFEPDSAGTGELLAPSTENGSLENTENSSGPHLVVGRLPSALPTYLRNSFSKHVDVFGVQILGTDRVSDDKLIHAATVLAEYLDNDEDGQVDNSLVLAAMLFNQATLVVFANESDENNSSLFDFDINDGRIMQNLYAEEMVLAGNGSEGFDFSLEEVLHLVSHAGYSFSHPEAFGEEPGSLVAEAMDLARGGYFASVPNNYPSEAWYRYDDVTCEYDCQIAEYFYWALTSLLGAQSAEWRFDEIGHEWLLNTPEKLENGDPTMFKLLTDPKYDMPSRLPDGNYTIAQD